MINTQPHSTNFPTKQGFKEAVAFGVRIRLRGPSMDYILNTTLEDAINPPNVLQPGDSIVVCSEDRKWFARVTRNLADTGYAVE